MNLSTNSSINAVLIMFKKDKINASDNKSKLVKKLS